MPDRLDVLPRRNSNHPSATFKPTIEYYARNPRQKQCSACQLNPPALELLYACCLRFPFCFFRGNPFAILIYHFFAGVVRLQLLWLSIPGRNVVSRCVFFPGSSFRRMPQYSTCEGPRIVTTVGFIFSIFFSDLAAITVFRTLAI